MIQLIVSLSHFLHLLATVLWIGGIVMVLLVILPAARTTLESATTTGRLMKDVTRRFTPMANGSILLLVLTGLVIGFYGKGASGLAEPDKNLWLNIILLKHFFVASMIIIHFYRGLILGSKIKKLSDEARVARLKGFSLNLLKANLALGVTVLLLTGIASSL